jgi:hypothetical protein
MMNTRAVDKLAKKTKKSEITKPLIHSDILFGNHCKPLYHIIKEKDDSTDEPPILASQDLIDKKYTSRQGIASVMSTLNSGQTDNFALDENSMHRVSENFMNTLNLNVEEAKNIDIGETMPENNDKNGKPILDNQYSQPQKQIVPSNNTTIPTPLLHTLNETMLIHNHPKEISQRTEELKKRRARVNNNGFNDHRWADAIIINEFVSEVSVNKCPSSGNNRRPDYSRNLPDIESHQSNPLTQKWCFYSGDEETGILDYESGDTGFNCAIVGPGSSGKSHYLSYILKKYFWKHIEENRVLFMTPEALPEMNELLVEGLNWSRDLTFSQLPAYINQWYMNSTQSSFIRPRSPNERPLHYLIVIDDKIAEMNQLQRLNQDLHFSNLITRRRHHARDNVVVSFLLASQKFSDIPYFYRSQIYQLIVFMVGEKQLEEIRQEFVFGEGKEIGKPWQMIKREIQYHLQGPYNYTLFTSYPTPAILANMQMIIHDPRASISIFPNRRSEPGFNYNPQYSNHYNQMCRDWGMRHNQVQEVASTQSGIFQAQNHVQSVYKQVHKNVVQCVKQEDTQERDQLKEQIRREILAEMEMKVQHKLMDVQKLQIKLESTE